MRLSCKSNFFHPGCFLARLAEGSACFPPREAATLGVVDPWRALAWLVAVRRAKELLLAGSGPTFSGAGCLLAAGGGAEVDALAVAGAAGAGGAIGMVFLPNAARNSLVAAFPLAPPLLLSTPAPGPICVLVLLAFRPGVNPPGTAPLLLLARASCICRFLAAAALSASGTNPGLTPSGFWVFLMSVTPGMFRGTDGTAANPERRRPAASFASAAETTLVRLAGRASEATVAVLGCVKEEAAALAWREAVDLLRAREEEDVLSAAEEADRLAA